MGLFAKTSRKERKDNFLEIRKPEFKYRALPSESRGHRYVSCFTERAGGFSAIKDHSQRRVRPWGVCKGDI